MQRNLSRIGHRLRIIGGGSLPPPRDLRTGRGGPGDRRLQEGQQVRTQEEIDTLRHSHPCLRSAISGDSRRGRDRSRRRNLDAERRWLRRAADTGICPRAAPRRGRRHIQVRTGNHPRRRIRCRRKGRGHEIRIRDSDGSHKEIHRSSLLQIRERLCYTRGDLLARSRISDHGSDRSSEGSRRRRQEKRRGRPRGPESGGVGGLYRGRPGEGRGPISFHTCLVSLRRRVIDKLRGGPDGEREERRSFPRPRGSDGGIQRYALRRKSGDPAGDRLDPIFFSKTS